MWVKKSCGYAGHYSKKKSQQITTKHVYIRWNILYIFSDLCKWSLLDHYGFLFYEIEVQIMGSCRTSFEIEQFIHNITNWRVHESTKNLYSNYNKTKLNHELHTHDHYDDVIMGAIASLITSLTIVYSTVYSDANQRKPQSSASLASVWGIHRGPVNSPHKWPVTRKMFSFDDVIMY